MGHPNIKMATSVVDYVFRVLGLEYLKRTDVVHVKPSEHEDHDPAENPPQAPSGALEAEPDGEESNREAPWQGERSSNGTGKVQLAPEASRAVPKLPQRFREKVSNPAGKSSESRHARFYEEWVMSEYLSEFMGDAPTCSTCGQFTIRSGSCYRCLFCGESQSCS